MVDFLGLVQGILLIRLAKDLDLSEASEGANTKAVSSGILRYDIGIVDALMIDWSL